MPRLSPQSKQLIILRLYRIMRIVGCHVPIILSVHIYLGALLWSWQLDNACNIVRYFISENLTLPHCHCSKAVCTFLCSRVLDPYIRRFVRYFNHSHHIYFIDPRPMGYTIHLWTAFVLLTQITVSLSRLHRASDKISFLIMPVGVSGEAFRGVTPSFHLSDYQFS